jgi:hypothetical protein
MLRCDRRCIAWTLGGVIGGLLLGGLTGGFIAPPVSSEPWLRTYQGLIGGLLGVFARPQV